MTGLHILLVIAAAALILIVFMMVRIVPNQKASVVERLGKYSRTLRAGFHILIPFVDRVAYKHSLKEVVVDVVPQNCITADNITISIDGVLFFKVINPEKASYGINDYASAITQLAKTTMRSQIGKLSLDTTFKSREEINNTVVQAIDEASDAWGIKVTRYEIKDLEPPQSLREAMEKQMRAEREKRALIAKSEGERQAQINLADADKQQAIMRSEGEKIKQENEALGKGAAIYEVAKATALGIKEIAGAIEQPGGKDAVSLRIATDWIQSFGNLAKTTNSMIVPTNVADMASITSILSNAYEFGKKKQDT
ncbi:TPA: paraslipin [Candidatus Delongbacteria bacterium]|nr:paraslipin [Candidatus Delongbacteria bacterium]